MDKRSRYPHSLAVMELRRILSACLVYSLLWAAASMQAFAQQGVVPNDQNPPQGANLGVFNPLEQSQFWLTGAVIGSGLLFFAGQMFLLRGIRDLTADDIVRNCSITIVIVAATVLIVAGYNSQQTAQAFGLFGTIIGYLLGRSAGRRDPAQEGKSDATK